MKTIIALLALMAFSSNAHAAENDFKQATTKALAAGSPGAVLKTLDKEVSRGNLLAALQLGRMYRDGNQVTQDFAKAKKYLKTAAKGDLTRIWYRHGYELAQYELAIMLQAGSGGSANPAAAEPWFLKAAELGNTQAQFALARLYFSGTGVKRNPEQAFFWSSIAAVSLSDAEQKEAEAIRDQTQSQIEPKLLAKTKHLLENWKHKT